jgi:hypothetical protein
MSDPTLTDFATRYAAAWSSQDPVSLQSLSNSSNSAIAVSRARCSATSM